MTSCGSRCCCRRRNFSGTLNFRATMWSWATHWRKSRNCESGTAFTVPKNFFQKPREKPSLHTVLLNAEFLFFFILVYLCKKTQRNNNKGISCLTCKVPWSIPFQSTLKFHFCTVGNLPQVNKCAYYLQYLQTFLVCVYESCFHLWADIWQLVPLFLG